MQPVKTRARRTKKKFSEMMPVKKWLSLAEACCYMDMSINHFQDLIIKKGLSIAIIGAKKYYKVAELEELIEENILIKKIS